jgi:hypothetical protein
MEFLVDLGLPGMRLEKKADGFARDAGLIADDLPEDAEALQQILAPALQESLDFRMLRMLREWQLDQHGWVAMDAFEEMRLDCLQPRPESTSLLGRLRVSSFGGRLGRP